MLAAILLYILVGGGDTCQPGIHESDVFVVSAI